MPKINHRDAKAQRICFFILNTRGFGVYQQVNTIIDISSFPPSLKYLCDSVPLWLKLPCGGLNRLPPGLVNLTFPCQFTWQEREIVELRERPLASPSLPPAVEARSGANKYNFLYVKLEFSEQLRLYESYCW